MALPTKDEIRTGKLRRSTSGSYQLTLPREMCLALEMSPSACFVTIRAVGPCIVISKATDVAGPDTIEREANEALAALVKSVVASPATDAQKGGA